MTAPGKAVLPPELLESQLAMVDLIRAMYPSSEHETDHATEKLLDEIRERCENPDSADDMAAARLPPSLSLTITVPIDVGTSEGSCDLPLSIQMSVHVPLSSSEREDPPPTEPPPLTYSLRQPAWLSRAEVADLGTGMPPDDILAAFDHVQENATRVLASRTANGAVGTTSIPSSSSGPLLRVWFYFPSLSTREKRRDLVSYAPRYGLTGFVLAGKPGVLCLEGASGDVDGYMNAIKNESWGDIPSHQKKVSERFREECGDGGRRFVDMSEITDDLGEKRGARKNRGDMAALEAFLKEKGVGESFSKVVMGA